MRNGGYWRRQPRDWHGRWISMSGGVKSAARALSGTTSSAAAHRPRYVEGSFGRNLYVGQGGHYKGIKAGAEFRTPGGRGVLVKGIAGYHGKPDRRLDVTPSYTKRTKTATIKARPNPQRKKKTSAGSTVTADPIQRTNDWIDEKAKDLAKSAVDKVPGATAAGKFVAAPARSGSGNSLRAQSAGRKVRR